MTKITAGHKYWQDPAGATRAPRRRQRNREVRGLSTTPQTPWASGRRAAAVYTARPDRAARRGPGPCVHALRASGGATRAVAVAGAAPALRQPHRAAAAAPARRPPASCYGATCARRCNGVTALASPADTLDYLRAALRDRSREIFTCLFLDTRHRVIACEELFQGSIDGACVYPRVVAEKALRHGAAAMIIAHNHPSGVASPAWPTRPLPGDCAKPWRCWKSACWTTSSSVMASRCRWPAAACSRHGGRPGSTISAFARAQRPWVMMRGCFSLIHVRDNPMSRICQVTGKKPDVRKQCFAFEHQVEASLSAQPSLTPLLGGK